MANEVQAPQVDIEKISEGHDLSLLGLIADADIFVQLIMFLLIVASIWCWTIIINKSKMIRREKKEDLTNVNILQMVFSRLLINPSKRTFYLEKTI